MVLENKALKGHNQWSQIEIETKKVGASARSVPIGQCKTYEQFLSGLAIFRTIAMLEFEVLMPPA